jgi:predicted Na+-dependent transporter
VTATGLVLAVLPLAAMLAIGTTVEPASFRSVMSRPFPVIVALAANVAMLPGLALRSLAALPAWVGRA